MPTTHTPGPYRVDDELIAPEGSNVEDVRLVLTPNGEAIAWFWPMGDWATDRARQHERDANARLFAAAPDVAATLRDFLTGSRDLQTLIDRARLLIARIDGEEN